jgi:hypothetical protein
VAEAAEAPPPVVTIPHAGGSEADSNTERRYNGASNDDIIHTG